MKIDKFSQLFREDLMHTSNTYHSRGDIFWAKQEKDETPKEH